MIELIQIEFSGLSAMGVVFAVSASLILFWALKEYDLLNEKDVSEREWKYFLQAKRSLNLWAAVIMASALVVENFHPKTISIIVGSSFLLTSFGPKFVFRILKKRPSR